MRIRIVNGRLIKIKDQIIDELKLHKLAIRYENKDELSKLYN